METLINRSIDIFDPFKCAFATTMPIQPERPGRPPPDLPIELWLDIFQFATYVHRSASIKPLDPFTIQRTSRNVMGANTPALAMYTKLALVQVCKAWRVPTIPLLYEHIVIRSPPRANAILRVLQESASPDPPHRTLGYGQWTRHIEIYTHSRGSGGLPYLETIFSIFQQCPNIRILSGMWTHPIPTEFLKAISRMFGPSLEGLCWSEVSDNLYRNSTPSIMFDLLASLKSLRIIDLRHVASKNDGLGLSEAASLSNQIPKPTLPLVEDLILSSNPRSLGLAACLCLPSLRRLTIKTPVPDHLDQHQLQRFLVAHGASLESVDLPSPSPDQEYEPDTSFLRRSVKHINPDIFLNPDACPNLKSISFPVTSPLPQFSTHPRMRRIGLRGVRADILYPDRPSVVKSHLDAITNERYPNLETVQTIGFLVEADVDGLIKDVFIWWVEKFEKLGIDLVDGEGVLWEYADSDITREERKGQGNCIQDKSRTSEVSDSIRDEGHGTVL